MAPLIPAKGRMGRPRKTDLRRVFDAIQSMLASGCQWRLIPSCHPPFSTVQNDFHAWLRSGVLERMLDALRAPSVGASGSAVIDSQSVKTTQCGGPAGKKIKGRKRHLTVDTEGSPIVLARRTFGTGTRLWMFLRKAPGISKVFADGGHGGPRLRDALAHRN